MPEFIRGDKPEIKFSSREELAAYFREKLADLFDSKNLGKPEDFEHFVQNRIDGISRSAFELNKDGIIRETIVESGLEGIVKRAERAKMPAHGFETSDAGSFNHESLSKKIEHPARRTLLLVGLSAGTLLTVHGAIAAATSVRRDDGRTRDWNRTALHTAEAVLGGVMAWASFVALRGGGRLGR